MSDETSLNRFEILTLTAEIVSAYAGNNVGDTETVPALISSVFGKLSDLAFPTEPTLKGSRHESDLIVRFA